MKTGAWVADPTIRDRASVALIVSPHLDDAVISCGLAIQALRSAGWAVFAATVFSDAPSGPVSPIAIRFNTAGDGDAVRGLKIRRSEDRAALTQLGASPLHLGFSDASLRRRADGSWLCEHYEDIRRLDPCNEPALRARIRAAVEAAVTSTGASLVLGPAAVGGHVDHRLVHAAVADISISRRECTLFRWFEDLPYAFDEPSGGGRVPFCRAGERELAAKLDALALYTTQLRFLGGATHSEGWRTRFMRHAYDPATQGFVERVELAIS